MHNDEKDEIKLSILIPTYHKNKNSDWLLRQCIKSIHDLEPGLLQHTLVIDDASPHPSTRGFLTGLQKEFGFQIIYRKENQGYSKCINTGLRAAIQCGYTHALTLNNDVELKTPILQKLTRVFSSDKNIGIVGALLFYQMGRIQHAGFEVYQAGAVNLYEAGALLDCIEWPKSRYIMGVTGAFQAISLNHIEKMRGIYSEKYEMSYEDVEFCLRAWMNDVKVYFDSSIYAVHCESPTRGYVIGEREKRSMEQFKEDLAEINIDEINKKINHSNK